MWRMATLIILYLKLMIIFESLLITFEATNIFWGNWGSSKNWLEA